MLQCSAPAAECLREHGATACTDVTGFGLAGHLLEMARASTVGVEIELRSLPLLDGSLELAGAGIFSSLQPQNRRLEHEIESREQVARAPMFSLLFDPQTAGGLLASVPATKAQTCVQALSKLGYQHAAIVGRVLARKTDQPTIRVY
jgi:selenide,water dikinase